jgi:hypothetical protein
LVRGQRRTVRIDAVLGRNPVDGDAARSSSFEFRAEFRSSSFELCASSLALRVEFVVEKRGSENLRSVVVEHGTVGKSATGSATELSCEVGK